MQSLMKYTWMKRVSNLLVKTKCYNYLNRHCVKYTLKSWTFVFYLDLAAAEYCSFSKSHQEQHKTTFRLKATPFRFKLMIWSHWPRLLKVSVNKYCLNLSMSRANVILDTYRSRITWTLKLTQMWLISTQYLSTQYRYLKQLNSLY